MKKLFLIVLFFALLAFTACSDSSSSSSDSSMKDAIPAFTGTGTETVTSDDNMIFAATYAGVSETDFTAYVTQINAAGWVTAVDYSSTYFGYYSYEFSKEGSNLTFTLNYSTSTSEMTVQVFDEDEWTE